MLRIKVLAQDFRILCSRPRPAPPLLRRSGEESNGPQGQRPGLGPGPVTSDGRATRSAASAEGQHAVGWTESPAGSDQSAVPSRVGKLLRAMTLWDQGSLCPDLPIVQEKPKTTQPPLFFFW